MKKSVKETVREAIEPTVLELGYRIWDVTFTKIGADYHLEITIDSDNGIGIDDCEKVHRAIDPILDECDPVEGFYYLEVSSPGLERELRTPEHILSSLGMSAEAKLFTAKNGEKSVVGTLVSFEDGVLTMKREDGTEVRLEKSEISKLQTVYREEDFTEEDN
ncbi:MAG: ribosome maturation factor RimP [Clostridia bacterium]|nr:ribosome maturation factor RimP [Clostridia bacterium]